MGRRRGGALSERRQCAQSVRLCPIEHALYAPCWPTVATRLTRPRLPVSQPASNLYRIDGVAALHNMCLFFRTHMTHALARLRLSGRTVGRARMRVPLTAKICVLYIGPDRFRTMSARAVERGAERTTGGVAYVLTGPYVVVHTLSAMRRGATRSARTQTQITKPTEKQRHRFRFQVRKSAPCSFLRPGWLAATRDAGVRDYCAVHLTSRPHARLRDSRDSTIGLKHYAARRVGW